MIQIRDNAGKVCGVVEGGSVEILDDDANLAVVVAVRRNGFVDILTPTDPLFRAYAHANRLKSAKVHLHKSPEVMAKL